MSVASRIADGWVNKAAWWFEHDRDRADFVQTMVPYQPGEDYRTLNRIWELGRQAYFAAQRLNQSRPGQMNPAGAVPGAGRAGAGYRYVVVGTWEATGGAGTQYRTVQVDSPFQLDTAGLTAELAGLTPPQQIAVLGSGFPPTNMAEWRLTGIDVRSVVRV